jgi:hypothetical protein
MVCLNVFCNNFRQDEVIPLLHLELKYILCFYAESLKSHTAVVARDWHIQPHALSNAYILGRIHTEATIPDTTMFERRGNQYPHPSFCGPRGGDSL